ncbi:flagellar protein FlhE [Cobetia sp. D5]|uniref:flagellar protein FlhE n=1 Tax=Cobetia sp. D5 TaxID=3105867 RepID=UPI002D7A01CB|nr:flagellar protein FlhE [Cobetia sp. D5]
MAAWMTATALWAATLSTPAQAASAAVMMSVESLTIAQRGHWYMRPLAVADAVRDSGLMAPDRTRVTAIHWRYSLTRAPGEWQIMLCQEERCAMLEARRGKLTLPTRELATAPFSLKVYRNGRGVLKPAAHLDDIQLVIDVESLEGA